MLSNSAHILILAGNQNRNKSVSMHGSHIELDVLCWKTSFGVYGLKSRLYGIPFVLSLWCVVFSVQDLRSAEIRFILPPNCQHRNIFARRQYSEANVCPPHHRMTVTQMVRRRTQFREQRACGSLPDARLTRAAVEAQTP
ncbi:unnamed protein product [Leptosia nina]|uniref:Uncharacterized protein n=1 Tax=Leptosia nina TaxID=320188 RepID=A0AAV1JS39_9NEOP